MSSGGARVGAGRPRKGEERPEEERGGNIQLLPLEYMMQVINDPTADKGRRDRMAVAAAPYLHAKPGEQGKKEERQQAANQAASGRYAPSEPPGAPSRH